MSAPVWHLLSADRGGGVAGYAELLAAALADAGREVHYWVPTPYYGPHTLAVAKHELYGLDPASFRRMGAALDRFPAPRRLLVQYAPQAWGMRGMNVPFCSWLLARRRAGDDVRVMFHEPFFPFGWQRPQRNLLAAVNRWMAWLLLRASTRAYLSIAAWEALLRPLAPPGLAFTVLPIPSTTPFVDDPLQVCARREEIAGRTDRPVFVHFGTYGQLIAPMLRDALRALIERRPDARIALLGLNGPAFADRLRAEDARFADALVAPGFLGPEDLSLHLQAADAAIQPYPDGADTRRTSLMACLANGVPTVTTRGRFTEELWTRSPLALVDAARPERMADAAIDAPGPADREARGAEIRAFYRGHFAMEHTIGRLLADEGGG
ncbi:MAG TPA: glycosyltransferase [Longimicrobium sp.]|nr:glycosyltransferase [Longimicrobium sp.]